MKINGKMKVKTLKSQFKEEFGLTLRVYDGQSFADENVTLASIREKGAKVGELSIRRNIKVSNLEKKFSDLYGIKIKVAGSDDSYLCMDDDTLLTAKEKDNKSDYSFKNWFVLEIGRVIEDLWPDEDDEATERLSSIQQFIEDVEAKYSNFYYNDEVNETKTYYLADYRGSGIRPLLKEGAAPTGEELFVSDSIENVVEFIENKMQNDELDFPVAFYIIKICLFDKEKINIEIQDFEFFVGDENFGAHFIDNSGLCLWLSENLGLVTVYIQQDDYIYSQCWEYGSRDEGFYNFMDIDFDSCSFMLPNDEEVMEEDEDACFEPNISENVLKFLMGK